MIQFQSKPIAAPAIVPCMLSLERRMAEDMREMAFAGENVSPETLKMRGYSAAAVKRLSEGALRIARRLSIRQIAEG
jgi:hypothetical protein